MLSLFMVSLIVGSPAIAVFMYALYKWIHTTEHITFPPKTTPYDIPEKKRIKKNRHNILIINSFKGFGGGEVCVLNQYKKLLESGKTAFLLSVDSSPLTNSFREHKLPFFLCNSFKISWKNYAFHPGLTHAMYKICKQHNISIIHCNDKRDIVAAQKVAKKLPVKIAYTHHTYPIPLPHQKKVNGIVGINQQITGYFEQEKKNPNQIIHLIPPFLDEEKFTAFTPTSSKRDFFKKNWNLDLGNIPLFCSIANFHVPIHLKGHPLLFKALRKLIHEKNKPVHVVLAGKGPGQADCKKMIADLALNDYVHFLDYTTKTPELLFFSDAHLLANTHEAFGLVSVEAALIKKPSVIAHGTGAAGRLVIDNETGLLFEPNNADCLAEKIETLVDNPGLTKTLGEKAYTHVKKYYSNDATLKKLCAFYDTVATR